MPPQTAPIILDAAAVARVGGPAVAGYLPGWTIQWVVCSQEQIDQLVPGALAVCRPIEDTTATRRVATIYVVSPWPASESLADTIQHELVHAWISPLVALIPDSAAAIMIEEQLVEDMGKYLAGLPSRARRSTELALDDLLLRGAPTLVGSAVEWAGAPAMRARILARAGTRARGGQMDPDLVKQALDALEAGDGAKCAELLKGLIAAAASNGAAGAAGAMEPDGDEAAKAAAPPGSAAPSAPPMDSARTVARKGHDVETEDTKRARIARAKIESEAVEATAATSILASAAREQIVDRLRARLPGHDSLPFLEKEIAEAENVTAAKKIADIAIKMGGVAGAQRARSGVEHVAAPNAAGGNAAGFPTFDALVAEGMPTALARELVTEATRRPELATSSLRHARARLNGGTNEFLPTAKPAAANGARS